MKDIEKTVLVAGRKLYGYDIRAEVTLLKEDIHVLITGGSLPHVGAVSVYCDGSEEGWIQLPGHKEKIVADHWSRVLSEECCCRVTTVCGIHYDDLSKKDIAQIISAMEELLLEILYSIRKEQFYEKKEN